MLQRSLVSHLLAQICRRLGNTFDFSRRDRIVTLPDVRGSCFVLLRLFSGTAAAAGPLVSIGVVIQRAATSRREIRFGPLPAASLRPAEVSPGASCRHGIPPTRVVGPGVVRLFFFGLSRCLVVPAGTVAGSLSIRSGPPVFPCLLNINFRRMSRCTSATVFGSVATSGRPPVHRIFHDMTLPTLSSTVFLGLCFILCDKAKTKDKPQLARGVRVNRAP